MCDTTAHAGGATAPHANGDTRPAVSERVMARAVTFEAVLRYFRTQGGLASRQVLFVPGHNQHFVETLPKTAQPSMLLRDRTNAGQAHPESHLFEPRDELSRDRSLIRKTAPSMGALWLAFSVAASTLALLAFVLVTLAKV